MNKWQRCVIATCGSDDQEKSCTMAHRRQRQNVPNFAFFAPLREKYSASREKYSEFPDLRVFVVSPQSDR